MSTRRLLMMGSKARLGGGVIINCGAVVDHHAWMQAVLAPGTALSA